MLRSGEISCITLSKVTGFLISLHALRSVGMTAQGDPLDRNACHD